MSDLFEHAARYPAQVGHRQPDTSKDAARDMQPKQGRLQKIVLDCLKSRGPSITREIAYATGVAYGSIQPRTSELRKKELIQDSGERRIDPETGKRAIVWRAA